MENKKLSINVYVEGGYNNMADPYEMFVGTPLWDVINKGINDLVENKDIEETTNREYIVGYLCKKITESENE